MRFADLALRLLGATSGEQIIKTAAAASGAITLPAGTTDFSATGGASQVVRQSTAGGPFTVGQLAVSDVSNVTAARLLGNPTGSPAAPSEISLGTGLSFSGTVLNGQVGTLTGVTAGTGLTGGGTTGNPTINLSTPVSVANGGTGLAAGTSGGIPYYSAPGTMASSAALTANALIKGGGAGLPPVASTATLDVSGNLTVFNNLTVSGGLFTGAGGNSMQLSGNNAIFNVNVVAADNTKQCGFTGAAWSSVASYAYVTSSSASLKTGIEPVMEGALARVMALAPATYRWRDGPDTGRRHHGFLAEAVREALGDDFGGFVKDEESGLAGLAYNELTAVLWRAVQELSARVVALEARTPPPGD